MARGSGGRGRGRGRGRVPVCESAAGLTQGAAQEQAADSPARQEGPVGGGAAGPQAGAAAGGVREQDVLMVRLLQQILEHLPGVAPAQGQAPVAPGVAGVQPGVAAGVVVPSYLEMLGHMGRITTAFFSGGTKPEEASEWMSRLERNFQSLRCPEEYWVDLAVHHLVSDAHLWWRGVIARRPRAGITWADFVAEFNAKFFPPEAVDRLEERFLALVQGGRSVRGFDEEFSRLLVYAGREWESERDQVKRFFRGLRPELRTQCRAGTYATRVELVELAAGVEDDMRELSVVVSAPVQPPRRPQQQAGSSVGCKPMQGQKRKLEHSAGSGQRGRGGPGCFRCGSLDHKVASCPKKGEAQSSQGGQGCYGCGSMEHRVASCPKRVESRVTQVCFYCKEPGHIKPQCPRLQQGIVAVVQPSQQGAAVVQPLQQIAAPARVYTSVEAGGSSARPITGTCLSFSLVILL